MQKPYLGDGLFFIATVMQDIIGTVMAGYDGHRSGIYSIAVSPQIIGIRVLGSELLTFADKKLSKKGCMKINLQILEDNESVNRFYLSNGYQTVKRISMEKRLPQNIPTSEQASGVDLGLLSAS